MRPTLPLITLLCLVAVLHLNQADTFGQHAAALGKAVKAKINGRGAALAAVLAPQMEPRVFKLLLFKPLALIALVKIKLALLLGKPLLLLALKKLLLKPLIGALLLKIPLILHPGSAFVLKLMALKLALITKGLIGIKAPLALLVLGASALGSGIGLAIALGKLKDDEYYQDDYDTSYALPAYPPPRPAYSPPAPSYSSGSVGAYGPSASGSSYAAASQYGPSPFGGNQFDSSSFFSSAGGADLGSQYRKKRDADADADQDSDEDYYSDEDDEDIREEFEAARSNGEAYLHLAAQVDDKACGRRLMCEVYQKPRSALTEDEILLQEIFGYPLPELDEDDQGSGRHVFYRAAYVGATSAGRGGDVCARHFPSCPYDAQEMIDIFVNDEDEDEANEVDSNIRPAVGHQLANLIRYPPQVQQQQQVQQVQQQQQQQQQYQPLRYATNNGVYYPKPAVQRNFVYAPSA